jgi:enamine deaminase RidA (YjgF/YER057c/UK114 family)
MITKGGIDAITRSLASEYARERIRFNVVAPGVVDTPMHASNPKEFLKTPSPMGTISDVNDIVEAVVYLTEAGQVTGEVLHVDGCALRQMVGHEGSLQPVSAKRRLQDLGIALPPQPTPFGAYVEAVQAGNLLFLSGMLPVAGHEPKFAGRLGREFGIEQGRDATRLTALNVLSAVRSHLGSLDKVTKVVRLGVYLATEGDFFAPPKVADAASELFREVFSEGKISVRVVLGVVSLPLGMPEELEVTLEVEA